MASLVRDRRHRQVLATVVAPVDAGAVDVVEALSRVGVQTKESCQGPPVTVWFQYGEWWKNPWQDLAEFLFGKLAPLVSSQFGSAVQIEMIAATHGGWPRGRIRIHQAAIQDFVELLKKAQEDLVS